MDGPQNTNLHFVPKTENQDLVFYFHFTGHEIIAMNHSFHGRSIGALSVTGNAHYQEPFEPLMPGVKFADFNNLDSVKAQITDKTCAIIMETVQGEGGIYPVEKEFLDRKSVV